MKRRTQLVCKTLASIIAAAIVGSCSTQLVAATVVDYTTVPDTNSVGLSSISLGGTTVTGSANVTSANTAGSRGLGISGGVGSDYSLDLNETISINYGSDVTNATATFYDIDPFGNVTYQYELFSGITSLGVFPVSAHTAHLKTIDMSAQSGGLLFDSVRFSLLTSPPLGLKLTATLFDRVPEPGTLSLLALAATAISGSLARPRRIQ